jgi:uncharacterized protein
MNRSRSKGSCFAWARSAIYACVIILVTMAGLMTWQQERQIYLPRPYTPEEFREAKARFSLLRFQTSQGEQLAFYAAPKEGVGALPRRIWFMFEGNGGLALNWRGFIERFPDEQVGFVLIDYPGYGANQGKPSPAAMLENSDGAYLALLKHLGLSEQELHGRLRIMGYSLGAAAALQFAARHQLDRLILVAPFTSMRAMAWRAVGPFAVFLRHPFDNDARLKEVLERSPEARVLIVHGTRDTVIPVSMGEKLAGMFPGNTRFLRVEGASHWDIIGETEAEITAAMR